MVGSGRQVISDGSIRLGMFAAYEKLGIHGCRLQTRILMMAMCLESHTSMALGADRTTEVNIRRILERRHKHGFGKSSAGRNWGQLCLPRRIYEV